MSSCNDDKTPLNPAAPPAKIGHADGMTIHPELRKYLETLAPSLGMAGIELIGAEPASVINPNGEKTQGTRVYLINTDINTDCGVDIPAANAIGSKLIEKFGGKISGGRHESLDMFVVPIPTIPVVQQTEPPSKASPTR